jgi:uncharacterized protein
VPEQKAVALRNTRAVRAAVPFDNVFILPYGKRYIVHLPLRRASFVANANLVNLLVRARRGDRAALKKLGFDGSLIQALFETPAEYRHLVKPRNIPPFRPTSISLFLTSRCTLRCTYCYAEGGDRPFDMPRAMVRGILDLVLANVLAGGSDSMEVNFHGGGDLGASWPLFVEAREYLRKITARRGVKVRTSAGLNGYLNDEQRDWVSRNIDVSTISIDGPPHIHDPHRPTAGGGPSFPVVAETLRHFDKVDYPYGIRTTITGDSVGRMEEIVEYFCRHFASRNIKIEPMFNRGRSEKTGIRPPTAAEFIRHFRKAGKVARKWGRELIYSGARLDAVTCVFCQAAGDTCAVTPEGWVTSCYEVLSPEDPMAGTFFYGRFDMGGKRFVIDEKRRKALYGLNLLNKPQCQGCFCKWNCAGDCPVKSIHAGSQPGAVEPDRCRINRELTRDQIIAALRSPAESPSHA